ncbi:hypothetical protein B0T26DRAFT_808050 [Lasiosphaeria miniovina]|uniref:Aminoglycoside phosphotransferase domain-containing protein n=1 Tax=Lasiosphaeria miniovina TaxID=1954250 RepID=A0AA40EAW7_9PEZI|nr:uncharacterized protein B0T26DRAFT_808050 [Lasiosphaeria miniovina]KAK0733205.1 hypothetical protein B0T26DRAFT_808050 [Lasiosphaeria miniovina]
MSSEDNGCLIIDDWPMMLDGSDYDRKQLLSLVRDNHSPFRDAWNVKSLIREVEAAVDDEVVDIPIVTRGSSNLGLHCRLSNKQDIVVRLGRSDVNEPDYDGPSMELILSGIELQVAVNGLLERIPDIPNSRPVHFRAPASISGRPLMVFEKKDGRANVWEESSPVGKGSLLAQAACIRASLFNFMVPRDFITKWLLLRTFNFIPEELPIPITFTRAFWTAVLAAMVEVTIGSERDMIGWESDNDTVGPKLIKAKQAVLSLIPHILPDCPDKERLCYRPVLEHGDFGIYNMCVAVDEPGGEARITSLFDWETGCTVPAHLADPEMTVLVDLTADEKGHPTITRVEDDATQEYPHEYMGHARQYLRVLYAHAPEFESAIAAGRDARHL